MSYANGWPICDRCNDNIGYEAVFKIDGKDYCLFCQPLAGTPLDPVYPYGKLTFTSHD